MSNPGGQRIGNPSKQKGLKKNEKKVRFDLRYIENRAMLFS